MKNYNEMKLVFLSRSQNESYARVAVSAFIAQLDPTMNEIAEIKTIVSEAVTNSIVHGYNDKLGKIIIKVKYWDDGKIIMSITDNGCGIEDIHKAREPLFTTSLTGERAGMGFTIMESFSDKLKIYSKPSKGTRIVMEKRLNLK